MEDNYMATPQRSFPDVLQDIIANLQQMIRYEVRLAKTEIAEQATAAARPATMFGVGMVLAFYGVGFLLLACVYALSELIADGLATLFVGAVVGMLAVGLSSSSGY